MNLIHNVMNAVLNGITTSTFEEGAWELTVLILLKRFDLLDKYMWKEKIKWLIIPFYSSIVINILKYIINSPIIFISISAIITIYIGIIIMLKAPENNILNEKIAHIKVFLLVLLSFAIMIVLTESLYIPLFLKYFGYCVLPCVLIFLISYLKHFLPSLWSEIRNHSSSQRATRPPYSKHLAPLDLPLLKTTGCYYMI